MGTLTPSNIRITGHGHQGINPDMEDAFLVSWTSVPTSSKDGAIVDDGGDDDLSYVFIGVFDGHGGPEAALYAKAHLMKHITSQPSFWSHEDDGLILKAIESGFVSFHHDLECQRDQWRKTPGRGGSSGTSASVVFIRAGKLYLGHVGESQILLGVQDPSSSSWQGKFLTKEEKVAQKEDKYVVNKRRVGPLTRARVSVLPAASSSMQNGHHNGPPSSPLPKTAVIQINPDSDRCVILGSSGVWNVMSAQSALSIVFSTEWNNKRRAKNKERGGEAGFKFNTKMNPSQRLVNFAIERWMAMDASSLPKVPNCTVVTVLIDPPHKSN